MKFVEIAFGGLSLRARLLEERAPAAAAALWRALPVEGRAFQDQYSSQLMRTTSRLDTDAGDDARWGYQQPGLLMLDPRSGQLALCFGRGRLHDALGPVGAVPLAEIGGDLSALTERGERLQFEGAQAITVTASADQTSPLADAPGGGRRIALTLNGARAEAVLLEDVSPRATAALAAALPLEGKATNTYASGPLTRFWNSTGGKEGETPLDVPDEEVTTSTLYGGGYYLNTRPWRGIRISAQEPTAMGGGRSQLAPLFRFMGDWSAFAQQTAKLTMDGQRDLRIELA